MQTDSLMMCREYDIALDLRIVDDMSDQEESLSSNVWEPIFSPRNFIQQHQNILLQNYILSVEQLKAHGEFITQIRSQICEVALASLRQTEVDFGI